MKTQFIVTITQTEDMPLLPATLERNVRSALRGEFNGSEAKVTVRHMVEDDTTQAAKDPEADVAVARKALHAVVSDAHRAGQQTGRLLPKEGREKASAFADQAVAVLTK